VEGFILAVILNPIFWVAIYWFLRYDNVKCPHCGKLTDNENIRLIAVGQTVTCFFCKHEYVKPPS
jgi:hypothetical protein